MNIGAKFNLMACLTVLVGLITFCVADGKAGLGLVAMVVCLVGWLAGGAGGGWRPIAMPRIVVNFLVLGAIVNAAMRASNATVGQPIVSHLGEFLVYVQLLKLFDRRNSRDESQMLTLSIFVVIAAMLTSNTFPVGMCLLVYTPLMVTTAMLYQLRAGQLRALPAYVRAPERRPDKSGDPDDRVDAEALARSGPPSVVHGRGAARQLRRVAGVSLVATAALASVVFVITPRGPGAGALGRFGEGREGPSATGFNEKIRLGGEGFLQDNATPVLDLTVEDSAGNNLGGEDRTYYLRGVTRNHYEGPIWTSSDTRQRRRQVNAGETRRVSRNANDDPVRGTQLVQRITLRKPGRQEAVLFCIWRPLTVTLSQTSELLVGTDDFSLRRDRSGSGEFTYVVHSSPTDSDPGDEPDVPDAFPSGPIRDLAVSVLSEAKIAVNPAMRDRAASRQAANVIRDFLQRTCVYSRDMIAPAPNQDPIEMFLFETRRGHCEYFASAMVAMCQSVGLPARLAVGYVAADFNSLTGKYTVRQSNAHAWAEVHVGSGAWQTFDPSPPADITAIHRPTRGWLSSLRHWYESIEFGWNRSIIGFDSQSQKSSAIGGLINFPAIDRFFDDLTGRLFTAAKEMSKPSSRRMPGWLLPAVIACAAIAVVSTRRRRLRLGFRRARSRRSVRALNATTPGAEFYTAALKELDRGNASKPDSVPPLAHARRLRLSGVAAADPFAAISGLFYKLRFAGRGLTREEQAEAARLRTNLRDWSRMQHKR